MHLPPLTPSRMPWRVFVLAACLLVAWLVLLRVTGWKADLAESNFQANLIRITRYLGTQQPQIALVGSSVGGRLLPEFFAPAGLDVLNLGLDGSRPLFAFEVLRAHPQRPEMVLLETSALFQPLAKNDDLLREAMRTPTARLAAFFPGVRPEVRPVSVFYEQLKGLRERAVAGRAQVPRLEPSGSEDWKPETYDAVKAQVAELLAAGVPVVILDIPRGKGWAEPMTGPSRRLADELGLPVLEPGPAIHAAEGDVLRYSDGLHLDTPSARRVAEWIAADPRMAPYRKP